MNKKIDLIKKSNLLNPNFISTLIELEKFIIDERNKLVKKGQKMTDNQYKILIEKISQKIKNIPKTQLNNAIGPINNQNLQAAKKLKASLDFTEEERNYIANNKAPEEIKKEIEIINRQDINKQETILSKDCALALS